MSTQTCEVDKGVRRMLLILLMLCLPGTVYLSAQDIAKFGKISEEELQLQGVAEAPHSDAIYLFDVGEMELTKGFEAVLKRHVRIKILTEEGKEQANIRIPYWHKNKISGLKAHTITSQGKKIKMKDVFDEQEENWKYKVFTIPGVEVGSIIEYQYEMKTRYITYLEPWYFQHSEFTKLSRFSLTMRPGFMYQVFFTNVIHIEKNETDILRPGGVKLKKYTWTLENLPPIKKEPFMRTPKDYMAALHFQLVAFRNQYVNYEWITTWADVVKKTREHYHKFLKSNKQINEIIPTVSSEDNAGTSLDTARALYNYVRRNIESTSRGSHWVQKETDKILKDAKATGAEKNILLVNLLKAAGLEAHPLLISTHANGKIIPQNPNLDQFNYVLAYFKMGSQSYVLDTYRKNCPFNLLPTYNLVEEGLLIDDGDGKIIDVPLPRGINMTHYATNCSVSPEGDLTAHTAIRFEDYKGYFARDEIQDAGEEDFVKETLRDRFGEVEIDSFKIIGLEKIEEPLYLEVSFRVKSFAKIAGDMMYAGFPAIPLYKSNPLKTENRNFPVEFLYNSAATDHITLTIPQGFRIIEMPQNITRRYNDISFMIMCNAKDNQDDVVEIQRQILRKKVTYKVKEYHDLRNFYDFMVKADQGQLVINRAMVLSETNE